MKFTKHTSVALLSATLLTTVVACSKQNDTATTTQKSVTSSKVTHNSESAVSKQSRKDNIQIKLSQQEAIDKFQKQFSGKQLKSIELSREGNHYLRSEEHTSELQSRFDLVCRLLLEKKKKLILMKVI